MWICPIRERHDLALKSQVYLRTLHYTADINCCQMLGKASKEGRTSNAAALGKAVYRGP